MLLSLFRLIGLWKRFNARVYALSNLTNAELARRGIARADIPRAAFESLEG